MLKRAPILMWVLLLLFTAAILLYPVEVKYDTRPIQSPYIFPNLPLFALLYFLWIGLLLGLIFLRRERHWECLTLVCLFALVFAGFWLIITPNGKVGLIEWAHLSETLYVQETGNIPPPPIAPRYLAYPGLFVLTTSLSEVTGIDLVLLRVPFLLSTVLIFSFLVYVLFRRSLGSGYLASIAAVLLITGNVLVPRAVWYWPRWLGLLLLVLFLIVIYAERNKEGRASSLLWLLVMAASTIAYSVSAFFIPLMLASAYLLHKLIKTNLYWEVRIALSLVAFLAWHIYWATNFLEAGMVDSMVYMINAMREDLRGAFGMGLGVLQSNLGAGLPLWGNITRMFWLLFIFVFGALLAMKNLFSLKKLFSQEMLETGGFLAVALLSVLMGLFLMGGYEFMRYLQYGGFFLVPILLRFLVCRRNGVRQRGALLLLLLLFVMSFPTFLAHNPYVSAETIYPQEMAVGQFLKTIHGGQSGTLIYTPHRATSTYLYFNHKLLFTTPEQYITPERYTSGERRIEAYWEAVDRFIAAFEGSRQAKGEVGFVLSRAGDEKPAISLGISYAEPRFQLLFGRLESADRIYDSEFVRVYR